MPIESFNSPQSNSEENKIKRIGKKFVISSAHGKGSLTEGSENFGQTQKTTVFTGGESGMVEGSTVKKVEFHNNKTEDRTRETTYENSGRVVTRYNDRVEVKMPDGSVKIYRAKSPEVNIESTTVSAQTETADNFTIRPESEQSIDKETNVTEKPEHLNKAIEDLKNFTDASKSEEYDPSEPFKPFSGEELNKILVGKNRSELSPEEYGKIINRIEQVLARLERLSGDSEEMSELISEINSQLSKLHEEGVILSNKKNILDSKFIKLPAQKSESENILKLIQENTERIKQLYEEKDSLVQKLNNNRTEMSEIRSLGLDSRLKERLSREFMNKVRSEALNSIPAYNAEEEFSKLYPDNPELGRVTSDLAKQLISRDFDDQLHDEISQINPSLPSLSISSLYGPESIDYSRSNMNSNETYALNMLKNNPEARALFGNDELIDREYSATRDALYKRILKNGYSSPREIESAYLATDSFKDKDEKGLLFSVVRILDSEAKYKGYGEGIYFNVNLWNKVSEEQRNTLSAFYGSEDLEFISNFATSEKTPEQKIKFDSIIANFKEKLRNSL